MKRRLKWAFAGMLACLGLAVTGIAIVAGSALFADWRTALASDLLSRAVGYPVTVRGDARIRLGRISQVLVSDVQVASNTMPGLIVSTLQAARFDARLAALLDGRLDADNIVIDGLKFLFLKDEDGQPSWGSTRPPRETSAMDALPDILVLLQTRSVELRDAGVKADFHDNGFVFDFAVEALKIAQSEDGRLTTVAGHGTVNGRPTTLEGTYPDGEDFVTIGKVGNDVAELRGRAVPGSRIGEIEGLLTARLPSIADTIETLGLTGDIDGAGRLTAGLRRTPGVWRFTDIEARVDSPGDRHLTLTGTIANLLGLRGIDLFARFDTEYAGQILEPARSLRDFRLQSVSGYMRGDPDQFALSDLRAVSNLFDSQLGDFGPIDVPRIYRTAEGRLSTEEITAAIGPAGAPFITADGQIGDLLAFRQLDFSGSYTVPANELFSQLARQRLQVLGDLEGEFDISDRGGPVSLVRAEVRSARTQLLDMLLTLSVADLTDLTGFDLDLDFRTARLAEVMQELGLRSAMRGTLETQITLEGSLRAAQLGLAARAGQSDLRLDLSGGIEDHLPVFRGALDSALLSVTDATGLINAARQIGALLNGKGDQRTAKPLVLKRNMKPLVIQRDAKPLVLFEDTAAARLFDPNRLLGDLDIALATRIARIGGVQGRPSLNGTIALQKGILSVDPLVMHVVDGTARVAATLNLLKRHKSVGLTGSVNALHLGTLLTLFGIDMDASGLLHGRFALTLSLRNMNNLENAISGTARVGMAGGRIATSLLNLAGLGVIPWLFSGERSQGYSDITCIAAPLVFRPGRVQTENAVLDTPKVQAVVTGWVSWADRRLQVRAVPRPINRPGARSPFPVTIGGTFAAPDIAVRQGRDSGADPGRARLPCKP